MNAEQLRTTAERVVSRGIGALDESTPNITEKFREIGLTSTQKLNRDYRELLVSTPGIENFISGFIFFDETFRQTTRDGTPFPVFVENKGIIPGIKVDKGAIKLHGKGPDTFTQGLDDLGKRLKEYKGLGAKFAKWRAAFTISKDNGGHPSRAAIEGNANILAIYALLCQENGLVPIVEPEVLMDGDHTLDDCKRVTTSVLTQVIGRLDDYGVAFKGIILKPNMVTPGSKIYPYENHTGEIAQATLDVLRGTVRDDIPGIAFLSGGQNLEHAAAHLNMITKIRNQNPDAYRGKITFSFGRAIQDKARRAWHGDPENIPHAQTIFLASVETAYKASKGEL